MKWKNIFSARRSNESLDEEERRIREVKKRMLRASRDANAVADRSSVSRRPKLASSG